MAFVVARHNGRFELRESLHTPRGPRARTLAGCTVLSDEVLARAAARAQRPFDVAAVIDSGRRAGVHVTAAVERTASREQSRGSSRPGGPADTSDTTGGPADTTGGPSDTSDASATGSGGFLAATARMARSLRHAPSAERNGPGDALIDLLGFADAVRASQPARPFRPLAFPAIGRLAEHVAPGGAVGLAHR